MHEPLKDEFFWRIVMPFTDWTIWEGMVPQALAKPVAALVIWLIFLLAYYAWYRVEARLNKHRSPSDET
jgi:hypothetical protein